VDALNTDARAYDRYALRSRQARCCTVGALLQLDGRSVVHALLAPLLVSDSASDDSDEGESESEGDADADGDGDGAGAGDGAEMGATGELPAPADAMAEDDEEPPCPICHRYGASWRHWLCCDGTVNGKACAVWVHATCVNRKTKAQRAAVWLCEACDAARDV